MPNKWNYSFDYYYAAFAVLGIYVPGMNELVWYSTTLFLLLKTFSWIEYADANLLPKCGMQGVHICTPICLDRGAKLSLNTKRSRDQLPAFCSFLMCDDFHWNMLHFRALLNHLSWKEKRLKKKILLLISKPSKWANVEHILLLLFSMN